MLTQMHSHERKVEKFPKKYKSKVVLNKMIDILLFISNLENDP